jgi:hypothetical protein
MPGSRVPAPFWCIPLFSLLFYALTPLTGVSDQSAQTPPAPGKEAAAPTVPRGKKLVLKDGNYQLIREYEKNGDRVRYFSLERGVWEEIPASMVDWDATAKAATEEEKFAAEMVAKAHKQEQMKRMDNVTDVDASLQVGNGAFLPSGEGLFLVEGKSIRMLDQVGSALKTDKKREIERILSPVPLVPGKANLMIAGAHSVVRLRSKTPEFYLREAPFDPEKPSPINRTGRPNEAGPDVELIRVKVTHNARQVESFSSMFGEVLSTNKNAISMQRWEVAPNVYRYTLSEKLPPGEYVLAEVLPDQLNYFMWDFGVDESAAGGSSK